MAIYRAELSWDNLALSPTGTVDATWDLPDPVAGFLLAARIHDHSNAVLTPALRLMLYPHSFGGGPTYELMTQQQAVADLVVDFVVGSVPAPGTLILQSANGDNGAAFLAPSSQTLSMTIDDSAETVQFTGALGTITRTFAQLGWAAGTLIDINLYRIGILLEPSKSTVDWNLSVAFYNFYLSKDGTRIQGAQLGAVQAGVWSTSPWTLLNLGNPAGTVSTADGQTASRLLASFNWSHTTNVQGIFELEATWNAASAIKIADIDAVIALLCEEQSGTLIYARVIKQQIDAVEVGVSFDSGHTWTTQMVGKTPGSVYATPSLAEGPDDSVNLFIWDRSAPTTRWFRANTQGSTWDDAGILLDILPWSTSFSPRVFTLPSGFFLVSYNRVGHWFLAVYEGGQHTSAGIQTTDMGTNFGGMDTFPGMHTDAVGNIYAARAPSVLSEQFYRSQDLGVDWTNVLDTPTGSKQLMTCSHRFSPFIWKLWQTGTGAITVAACEDYGSVYLFGAIVAFAGAAQQYAGLSVLPKGFPIFVFQTYHSGTDSWSVDGFHSEDLGRTWIAN